MKKQILVLIVSIFALSLTSFGQVNPNVKVSEAPSCVADATSPAAGVLYNYKVDVAVTAAFLGTGKYDWYVTQNTDLLNPGAIITTFTDFVATGSYHGVANNASTIGITWSAASLANGLPYYLVVKYSELSGTCTAENMRVYRILPINTFILSPFL